MCEFPLSLLRRSVEATGDLAILVTCEACGDYHGFAIDLQMDVNCLEDFSDYGEET